MPSLSGAHQMPMPSPRADAPRLAGLAMIRMAIGGLMLVAALPAQAQTPAPDTPPADTEDVMEGATIVRGKYTAGETNADWEAALRSGKPERIAEWRDY